MRRLSRSSDQQPPDPPDEWVNGSWTVDCVCGVNFDDGEEMVNCDECGVWVHTRCSRYLKTDKSFACDKCKNSSSSCSRRRNNNSRRCGEEFGNEEEETEVAQLLIDLPAKTLSRSMANANNGGRRRRRRLWTEIPMEERVHVQGVPGGEVGVLGVGVFGPELWKCSGFVPKKFGFRYKEFGCWGDEDNDGGGGIAGSREGVGVRSESVAVPSKSGSLGGGTKRRGGDEEGDGVVRNTVDGGGLDGRSGTPQNGLKRKDRSSLYSAVFHNGKRKKEDAQSLLNDQTWKKKSRGVHIGGEDSKKRNVHALRSGDGKQLDLYEGRGLKTYNDATHSEKHEHSRKTFPDDPSSEGFCLVSHEVSDLKNNLAFIRQTPETSNTVSKHSFSTKARQKDKSGEVSARLQIAPKVTECVQSSVYHNDSGSVRSKEEIAGDASNVNDNGQHSYRSERIDSSKADPVVEDTEITAPRIKGSQNDQGSNDAISLTSLHQTKAKLDTLDPGGVIDVKTSPPCDVKVDGMEMQTQYPVDQLPESFKVKDDIAGRSQSIELKLEEDIDRNIVVADSQIDKTDGSSYEPCQFNGQLESESSLKVRLSNTEHKKGKPTEELSDSGGKILNPSEMPNQCKVVVPVGKPSSTTSTILICKTSSSDSRREPDAESNNFNIKQKGISEYKGDNKKDNSSTGVLKDRNGHENPKKLASEVPRSSIKVSHSSVSARSLSELKESVTYVKPSFVQSTTTVLPISGESASVQDESALNEDNKITTSGLLQRSVKANNLNCQPSIKTLQMPHHTSSNSPATLSDEELALLLHQELNSSPRVSRVPRMRHAGSLPQLASPTATSMLTKRASSSSITKDVGLVFKRKGKDSAQERSHDSREPEDETKNVNGSPFLSVLRRNDLAHTSDPVTKGGKDDGSVKGVLSVNKSIPHASSLTVGSRSHASSEANEQHKPSKRNTPVNASDEDSGIIRPMHRTLPGLLSEIIKDQHMTYEELCDAVLPHWPNLRKHNGERYAYSSHSQAVLDCLRNRTEWARLVDRGPKTNAGRKRRRTDTEAPSFDSEENDGNKDRNAKDVESTSFESHRDNFPKGKRKARKRRRRLALQGRGVKYVAVRRGRRLREADDVVNYGEETCSSTKSSSEESMFSEDEMLQGEGGTCPTAGRREASASSEG